ncbi:hypothetical protein [Calothrix sp. PCC 6303]|uniref:hypothetical protein n=1 Tax=Calothrix sp. PCC 6303 TaxID=1170562 RepID=UPI0002A059D9|nr:hypothetical protein [Calothrix sp. PCC 6303]AFZ01692.1 hypothetical protein Cal6303_2720 [Calothrix sp. PCC 6303]
MSEQSNIEILLILQDSETDEEELELLLQNITGEIQGLVEDVNRLPIAELPEASSLKSKGDKTESGVLDIKINLDSIKGMTKWLWERLVGTSTEAKIKYKDLEFEFKGKNQKDLAVTMQNMEKFIAAIAALQSLDDNK